MKFEEIISEAGRILGLQLPNVPEESLQIVDQNQRVWLVDCPSGSQQIKLSCKLPNTIITREVLEQSLMINGDRNRMGMSWLAIEKNQLVLGASVPLALLTGRQLSNLMEHMYCLIGSIEREFIR